MDTQTYIGVDFTARDPREFEYGLFIVDTPAHGGATGFAWFGSHAEALAYLSEQLPPLYLDGEDLGEISQVIATSLQGRTELKALDLSPINAVLAGMCEVRWAGTYYDLEAGNSPFELGIQANYRENGNPPIFSSRQKWS